METKTEQEAKEEVAENVHRLKGEWSSRRVWLDGRELLPGPSQRYYNHSPDGFNWGYGGSGPAQLALAITLDLSTSSRNHAANYQNFKWDIIAKLPQADFEIDFNIDEY